MTGTAKRFLKQGLVGCTAVFLVASLGAHAATVSGGTDRPDSAMPATMRPLLVAQADLTSRSNIRRLPARTGIATGARIQSLRPSAPQAVRPTRKIAPGVGNSRFSIDRRRIDNRGLNAGKTDGLQQRLQKRLGKQRLRTKTPDKEIVRKRQIAPSRLTKTKEQDTQPVKRAVKVAIPKKAGKGGLQTSAAGSGGNRRIPHHTPEWTNFADSDPGATGASPGVHAVWLTTGLADGPQPGSSAGWTYTRGWPVKWEGPSLNSDGAADAGTVKPFNATKGFGFVEFSVGVKPGPVGPTRYTNLVLKRGQFVGIADYGTQDIPFVVGRLFSHPGSVPPQDGPVDKPPYVLGQIVGGTAQAASFSELQGITTRVDPVESHGHTGVTLQQGSVAIDQDHNESASPPGRKSYLNVPSLPGTGGGQNEIVLNDTVGGDAVSPGHRIGIAHEHQPPTASVDGQRLEFLRLLTVPAQPAQPPFGTGLRQLEFAANSPAQGGGEVARKNTSTFKKTTGDDATGDASVGSTPSGAAAAGTIRGYDRTHRVIVGHTHAPTVGAAMTAGAGTALADSPDRPVLTGRVYNAEGNAGQAAGGPLHLPEVGDEVLTGFGAGAAAAPVSDPSGYVGVRQQQGRVVTDQDHDAARPGSAASGLPTGKRQHKPFAVTRLTDGGPSAAAELYDYPGDYAQRFDGVEPSQGQVREHIGFTYQKIIWGHDAAGTGQQPGESAGAFIRRLIEGGGGPQAGQDYLHWQSSFGQTGQQSSASGLPTGKRQHNPVTGRLSGPPASTSSGIVMEKLTIAHEGIERSGVRHAYTYQYNQSDLEFAAGPSNGDAAETAKDDGGRRTPFFTNYRPQFYFRATDGERRARAGDNLAALPGAGVGDGDPNRPNVIGSLFDGKDAGSRGHQSLYFPEQMLQEIAEPAGTADGYPGRYAQRFDDVSPDLPRVVVRGWDPVKKATVESQQFSGQYYVSGVNHQSADAANDVSAGSAPGGGRASGRTPSGQHLAAHEAVHAIQQTGSPPAGPVPVPYPTVAEAAVTADAVGKVGKPLLVIAEDVEGENGGTYGPWAYFRWSR